MSGARLWCNADSGLSPLDHGLLVGDGVFETLKVIDGVPFAWTRHVERLHASADRLRLDMPLDDAELRGAVDSVIASAAVDGPTRLRITVTSGVGPLGSVRGPGPGTIVLAIEALTPWPAAVRVAVSPWTRNPGDPLAGAKTTSYAGNVVALAWAGAQVPPAHEALFTVAGSGALSEGTGSNLFVGIDGVLHTPSLATACLAGVTRALVLEEEGGGVVERDDLELDDLRRADEAFLTSSTRDVQPVASIDGNPLPRVPGPLTKHAADAFAARAAVNDDP